jgi:UDP-N-acetylmuramoylalanine--D-glutamate ligase
MIKYILFIHHYVPLMQGENNNFMYKDKKIGVFGLGLSGLATIKYLYERGIEFIAFDDKDSSISKISSNYPYLANHLKDLSSPAWKEMDYLILSPGIALNYPEPHQVVKIAKNNNAQIVCDIELLYQDNQDSLFIGITGTNGKSTTASLVTHILKYNGVNAILGGNIGVPALELDISTKKKVFVIEVSSFQLDLLDRCKFNIAILLNITPDHLDRHGSMDNYRESKYQIFAHQGEEDLAIINEDLEQLSSSIAFSGKNISYDIPKNNSLMGAHNQENIAASIACCLKIGLSIEDILSAIPSFIGLKHRMQYLGEHNQVVFINDSKATNASSTEKALASLNNIIWIVGGVSKEGGIDSLAKYFPKVKQVLLIGESQDKFTHTCINKVSYKKCDDLVNAFKVAIGISMPGDVVLLSPSCSSYDQWKNFEERGESFIKMVQEL